MKKVVKELQSDIERICGHIRIVFASRKHPSIGNKVVRNKQLGNPTPQSLQRSSQQCNGRGCKTYPLLFQSTENITVNGLNIKLKKNASCKCKDKNVISIAQCQICSREAGAEDTYFGQALTPFHTRINGHRSNFCIDSRKLHEKSALSMHCFNKHGVWTEWRLKLKILSYDDKFILVLGITSNIFGSPTLFKISIFCNLIVYH